MDLVAVVERIHHLTGHDSLRARLLLAALATTSLKQSGYRPVVVGGTAVDAYVAGGFGSSEALPAQWEESLDLDAVVVHIAVPRGAPPPRTVLEQTGFTSQRPGGGSLRLQGVVFPLDIVGEWFPDDYSRDHVTTLYFGECEELGLEPPRVAGPEDILFDYMESGWHVHHQRDWARALAVAAVMDQGLDMGYLFTKAHWRMVGTYVGPLERLLRGEPLPPQRIV